MGSYFCVVAQIMGAVGDYNRPKRNQFSHFSVPKTVSLIATYFFVVKCFLTDLYNTERHVFVTKTRVLAVW